MSDSRAETHPVTNSLICQTQGFTQEDCSSPLVSDGYYWTCPFLHIQGFDQGGNPIRKIPDRRTSVTQGVLNKRLDLL